ncbi:hypothetical protein [Clostridium botulinum]|uniref:Uncharacterized protein n=1 Tax=Clostridium botulinum (strain Langeland / NCTC 10281 / Type F) TaxID=441772 RepID=A7G9C6_CLOBL|nr:hypothetical protein [Clostridium botulinum]ABS41262.1 hypothetical protein CLI_0031 [Clostridium botulinum F str. Langeland]KKM43743.1 hypothetical protein VT72_01015 [Clostridium botulinum]MBY6794594.1 hypothetical protein [Clostridium botulinum]MBY6939337.1 hypothetical protein [Clostridium botulinum]MBY6946496.1 hypothetical protein [Clostridium botulinum]
MIQFVEFYSTMKVLKEINRRLCIMIDFEFVFLNDTDDEYIESYFPSYICRENPDKCKNIIKDLQEWVEDYFLHDMTCLHEYALYKIIWNYSKVIDDLEEYAEKPLFSVEKRDEYSVDELDLLDSLQTGNDFVETLFVDIDFIYLDKIVLLYQINRSGFDSLGVNIKYYKELMPKDIRTQIETELKNEEKNKLLENLIIAKLKDVLKRLEVRPRQLLKHTEEEISDQIADMLRLALQDKIQIERETPVGYSVKKSGESDFFLSSVYNSTITYIAIGENKNWGHFNSQLNQLIAYLNENFQFGFTIVIVKDKEKGDVIEKQREILNKFNINGQLGTKNIYEKDDILVSVHENPENSNEFCLYHLILNLYHPIREKAAFLK